MTLTEKLLIKRIRRASGRHSEGAARGIGDDCAVLSLPRGHQALVTTDFSLQDVHFRREWHPPDSVGHRCLARGFSDIAAMGGTPHAAFLSLALPAELSQSWVDEFVSGLLRLARKFSVRLAGGDTAQSPDGVLADIVVFGAVPAGQAVLRSGARPGDLIYVTGTLGSSVAALHALREGRKLRPRSYPKHFYPQPRIEVGQHLRARKLASAMIDISDGLSTDLGHICEESGVGAVVYAEALPSASAGSQDRRLVSGHGFSRAVYRSTMGRALARDGSSRESHALALALHGGDEYELLFTVSPKHRIPKQVAGVPITRIGEILRRQQMELATADGKTHPLKPAGWEHFGG